MKTREEREYEERVKRRVLILKDLIENGKVVFTENMKEGLDESFSKARFDSNGEPDLLTIDARVRSLALAVEHFDHREKMKEAISLYQIQEHYFNRFETNFGHFYQEMVLNKLTPHQVAIDVAYHHDSNYLNEVVELIVEDLTEFWDLVAESAYYHLQDQHSLTKAVFGGDLFPAHNENIASKCGIYTDTIILPCPIIRSRHLFSRWDEKQRVYYLLKHALNILQYKELALTDLEYPIVVIVPDHELFDEYALEQVQSLGERDALYHAKKVFGREFSSFDEIYDFGSKLDSIEKVLKEIVDPSRVLFDTEFKEPLSLQIENQMKGESAQLTQLTNPGLIVSTLGLGRMSISNELLMKSVRVGGGIPLMDAPTSWQYFKWKLEYDGERTLNSQDIKDMHVVQALTNLKSTNLQWIGKIPTKGLIEIRKTGAIDEIRSILSKGVNDIATADYLDYDATTKAVYENLNNAFNEHQKNIKELTDKKWKIAGKDFGSWLVMGTVEMASAYTGTPLYGVSTVVLNQILDAPKLKDLPKSIRTIKDLDKQKENLSKSPIGLIFNYK
ncbi:hypothetical protein [Myroides marinus]|uniref:hypothetical protein n=1 Tax=Myroides marinus TaxID=703342 RepID=UPI002575939B|nr:hypothetical protein [Myroides marinus]MDM1354409.1 hypothetical protein [Myroides marinus]